MEKEIHLGLGHTVHTGEIQHFVIRIQLLYHISRGYNQFYDVSQSGKRKKNMPNVIHA